MTGFKSANPGEYPCGSGFQPRSQNIAAGSRSHEQPYKGCCLSAVVGIRQVKTMSVKNLIAVLAVMAFIPAATMALGKHVGPVAADNMFSGNPIYDAREQAFIVLAQNDEGNPEENEKAESASVPGESESAADDDKKPSEAESKPLKPFVPSEQIAGEQAVDFPADI